MALAAGQQGRRRLAARWHLCTTAIPETGPSWQTWGHRALDPPQRSSHTRLGGCAFLTSCLQSWLAPFWSESGFTRRPSSPRTAPRTGTQHRRGPARAPPARERGRGLCPAAKRGAETFLAASQFCHLPFQTCPCKSSAWLCPPSLHKPWWMLSSLSPGRRCSQKGLALDLPSCNKKQNLACFLDWEGLQYPSAELGT